MKVDELIEQERQVKLAMSNRSGVLGLMLHSTFNHDLDGRWQAQQRAAAVAQQQRKQQAMQQQQHMKHNQKTAK
jgi:COMPASS component SPP1